MKEVFKSLFSRDLDKLNTEINQYPSDNSLWIIKEGISNSAGNLSLHLCGNLRHFVGTILGKDGYVRDRDHEFYAKDLTREQLIDEVIQTKNAVISALDKLSESDLESLYPSKCPIPEATSLAFLTHLYGHLSYHLGQINYHRRLLA